MLPKTVSAPKHAHGIETGNLLQMRVLSVCTDQPAIPDLLRPHLGAVLCEPTNRNAPLQRSAFLRRPFEQYLMQVGPPNPKSMAESEVSLNLTPLPYKANSLEG